ncbi:hypothetical protein C8Q70DRAFT_936903 [Cubamyces menziesii]|nr:hypothetical protein C8Q70DRAFT_936903 [Cubamyces menziesii]
MHSSTPQPSSSDHSDDENTINRPLGQSEQLQRMLEVSPTITQYNKKARMVARTIHMFIQPLDTLLFGSTDNPNEENIESDLDDDADADDLDEMRGNGAHEEHAQREELRFQYQALLELLPNLQRDIKVLDQDSLMTLSAYISARVTAVRGDDGGALRGHVISYLRDSQIEEYTDAPQELPKFCETILAGPEGENECILQGGNFPAFLYDQKLANPEDTLNGLLRSPYFLACYKSLWTGPSSAWLLTGCNEKTPGRPPIAFANNFLKVTPRTLAYTAIQVRYELTGLTMWSTLDVGGYDGYELCEKVVAFFADPESDWAVDTLAWWQNIHEHRETTQRCPSDCQKQPTHSCRGVTCTSAQGEESSKGGREAARGSGGSSIEANDSAHRASSCPLSSTLIS